MRIDQVPTPAYVIDEAKLIKNLEILKSVQDRTGCKVLLAQKAFSMYATYPLISQYLAGTTASGLYEAKLGREEFGGEVHVFAPAFKVCPLRVQSMRISFLMKFRLRLVGGSRKGFQPVGSPLFTL